MLTAIIPNASTKLFFNSPSLRSLTKEEKYEHLRNKKLITLNGERVKSNGEKWIADFLFEHDKKYRYEKQFTCEKNNKKGYLLYNPDFTIYDKDSKTEYIIEQLHVNKLNNLCTMGEVLKYKSFQSSFKNIIT